MFSDDINQYITATNKELQRRGYSTISSTSKDQLILENQIITLYSNVSKMHAVTRSGADVTKASDLHTLGTALKALYKVILVP